jgi:phosphoglycerol transferase MdoB-like AlkP superfamily enzyme
LCYDIDIIILKSLNYYNEYVRVKCYTQFVYRVAKCLINRGHGFKSKDGSKKMIKALSTDVKAAGKIFCLPKVRHLPQIILPATAVGVFIAALKTDVINTGNSWLIKYIYIMIAVMVASFFIKQKVLRYVGLPLFAILPAACFLLIEAFIHDPFEIARPIIFLNLAFFYTLTFFVLFLTKRTWIAAIITSALSMVLGIINYLVLKFRGTPFFPWDISSAGTAANVINNYDFDLTIEIAAIICAYLFLILISIRSSIKLHFNFRWIRPVAAVLCGSLFLGYCAYLQTDDVYKRFSLYPYQFSPGVLYKRNGFIVSFLSNMKYLNVKVPDGYDEDAVEAIFDEYKDVDTGISKTPEDELPSIIVIMNEAFSDLSVLGDFVTNDDVIPFINSLEEDTIKGLLHVSVLGGNTANTEFEFLTGSTMAFLPAGSIPYQQYIDRETPNLTSQLADLGYKTTAIHPYYASGWRRNKVYPLFGFEKSVFSEDLTGFSKIRNYISDIAVCRRIMSMFDFKKDDEKLFIFNVTMQNHGSYSNSYDNFIPTIHVRGLEDQTRLTMYLSLLRESDNALRELCEYFKTYDDKTIILFFGDHQPADIVAKQILKLNGKTINEDSIEEREIRYIVPFVLWANYDIEEAEIEAISTNYLSTLLLKTAGIELTTHQKFLYKLYEKYPVITANCYIDAEGNYHKLDEIYDNEILNKYAILQYNLLFGDIKEKLFETSRSEK